MILNGPLLNNFFMKPIDLIFFLSLQTCSQHTITYYYFIFPLISLKNMKKKLPKK